jgi:hypothetical protein
MDRKKMKKHSVALSNCLFCKPQRVRLKCVTSGDVCDHRDSGALQTERAN